MRRAPAQRKRQLFDAGVEAAHRARARSTVRGIHQDDLREIGEGLHHRPDIAVALDHADAREVPVAQAPRHRDPHAVVAARRVADPDHERVLRHSRSRVSRRKWVAQEMQGS
jgi:hypothetical protein